MDYAKCEAIQKAFGRVNAAKNAEFNELMESHLQAAGCNEMSNRGDYLRCKVTVTAEGSLIYKAGDELDLRYEKTLAKIQSDYETQGCY